MHYEKELSAELYLLDLAFFTLGVFIFLMDALKNSGADFEDSVIYTSAKFCKIDMIITRDKKGFKKSSVLISEPMEVLASRGDF